MSIPIKLRLDRFTSDARESLVYAHHDAHTVHKRPQIESFHLVSGVMGPNNPAQKAFSRQHIYYINVIELLGPKQGNPIVFKDRPQPDAVFNQAPFDSYFTPSALAVLQLASTIAVNSGRPNKIDTEDILEAAIKANDPQLDEFFRQAKVDTRRLIASMGRADRGFDPARRHFLPG